MLRRIFYALLSLLLVGLVAMAWYVSSKGFTRKWRTYMVHEFRKAGVEVHIRRLTLDPFRGLVAKEVSVLDASDRKLVVAWIDEMLLGVNYAAAIRGQTFLDSADLREANLWLPLDANNPDGPKVEVSKLNARLFLPPKQIYLARAQAEIHGIQVFATGRLINPQEFQPSKETGNAVMEVGSEILDELAKLHYGNPAPTLSFEFSGDLAQPEQIQASLRFHAREVRRKNYEFKTVNLMASCQKGVLELQQVHIADERGELRASGTYDIATREIALRAHSTLHLEEIDRAFRWFPHLEDWELSEPPSLQVDITGKVNDVHMTGHAELHRSSFRRINFKELSTNFSWEEDGWSLRDFHMSHAAGELTGDATCRPGEFRAKISSTLNPNLISGLLKPEHAEWMARFDFSTEPTLSLDVHGTEPSLETCEGDGKLTYSRVLYQGRPAVPTSSTIHFAHGFLTIAPFTLQEEANGSTTALTFDFARHEVRLEKVPAPDAAPGNPASTGATPASPPSSGAQSSPGNAASASVTRD